MKTYKDILYESNLLWSDNKIIKALSKNLDDDPIFMDLALRLRNYNQKKSTGVVFLTKGKKKLIDELWYRIGSSLEDSEQFPDEFMKTLKKNFYSLEKTLFKNIKLGKK